MKTGSRTSQSWWFLFLASIALSIRSSQYADGNVLYYESFLREHYQSYLPTVALHATVGILTLALGPLLLHSGFRVRCPVAHRVFGYIYALAVLVGSWSGLFMARRSFGGPIAHLSFSLLAILWVSTVSVGVAFAIRRDYKRHRRWMIRNYALTLSALSFRILLTVFQQLGLPFDTAYEVSALLGWPLTLGVAELLCTRVHSMETRTNRRANGLQKNYQRVNLSFPSHSEYNAPSSFPMTPTELSNTPESPRCLPLRIPQSFYRLLGV